MPLVICLMLFESSWRKLLQASQWKDNFLQQQAVQDNNLFRCSATKKTQATKWISSCLDF